MQIALITVRESGAKSREMAALIEDYLSRCERVIPAEWIRVKTVSEVMKLRERAASFLILLDSRGELVSSESLAAKLGALRDGGKREVFLAIGPADGWTDADRKAADAVISLGKITLPHELAALVLAEQVWRACAILTGHPYHSGH